MWNHAGPSSDRSPDTPEMCCVWRSAPTDARWPVPAPTRSCGCGTSPDRSALDADHLTQVGDHLDEVVLAGDHLGDVLVGTGDLVDDTGVLAALDALGLSDKVLGGELAPRLGPGHAPPGTVARGAERVLVAQPTHDKRARAHRTRDDAQIAAAGADRALAGHQQVHATVGLLGHI